MSRGHPEMPVFSPGKLGGLCLGLQPGVSFSCGSDAQLGCCFRQYPCIVWNSGCTGIQVAQGQRQAMDTCSDVAGAEAATNIY